MKAKTVTQVNEYIAKKLSDDYRLKNLVVEGEISGLNKSGPHWYLFLKDQNSIIKANIWGSYSKKIDMKLVQNGKKVIVEAYISPYPKGGSYSLSITHVEAAGEGDLMAEFNRIKAKLEAAGIIIHYSKEHALLSWSEKYLPLSREYEYVTFLYSIDTPQGERFFTTQTFKGTKQGAIMSPNVLLGTAILAIHNTISSANLLAHVHTHPCPPAGFHNDFPSYSQSIYGGDRIVFEMLNLPEMYIFPYSTCTETSSMIVYSDKSTWCPFCS